MADLVGDVSPQPLLGDGGVSPLLGSLSDMDPFPVKEYGQQIQAALDTAAAAQTTAGQAKTTADGAAAAVASVQTTVGQHATQLAAHAGRLTDLEAATSALPGLTTRVTAVENAAADARYAADQAAAAAAGLVERVNSVESGISGVDTRVTALDTRLTAAEGAGQQNATAVAAIDTRVTAVEGAAQQNAGGIAALGTRMTAVEGVAAAAIPASQKGAAGGVATLGSNSLIPTAQLPNIPAAKLPNIPAAKLPAATATAVGAVELATNAETLAGTDAARAITPAALTAKILGTVSQSGGTPTGAMFQRTVNANGVALRYADGTQICFRGYAISGSLASKAYVEYGAHDWPLPFTTIDYFGVSYTGGWTGLVHAGMHSITNTQYSTNIINLHDVPVTISSGTLCVIAIGRWYG